MLNPSLTTISRRRFLATGTAGAALVTGLAAPAFSQAAARPVFTHGVQSGDVDTASGMIWTRVDRPSRVDVRGRDDRELRRRRCAWRR